MDQPSEEDSSSRRLHAGHILLMRTVRLSTFIEHATCQSLNGRCIGSKRRFVFRASPIYIRRLNLSFSHFQTEIVCQSEPSTLSEHSVEDEYLPITSTVTHPPPGVVSIYFNFIIKLHFRPCIVVRLTIPVNAFKPVKS